MISFERIYDYKIHSLFQLDPLKRYYEVDWDSESWNQIIIRDENDSNSSSTANDWSGVVAGQSEGWPSSDQGVVSEGSDVGTVETHSGREEGDND